jgi:hypothetical protein
MTNITVGTVKGKFALLLRYPGQIDQQGAYIELDTKTGELSADYNAEIGNAVPMRNWHGITRRYTIPALTATAANDVMVEITPLAQRVIDGTEIVWNGNNHVARLNDDAQQAEAEIEQLCEAERDNVENIVSCLVPEDWLYDIKSDTEGKTDAELQTMATEFEAEAEGVNGVLDALDTLKRWRDEYAAKNSDD